ncbi:MAG: imidazolonepropionase [Firmicutes bacterium]|nr:imidazolonepropionase [Bacillota bacterium]
MAVDLIIKSNKIYTCAEDSENTLLDGYVAVANGRIQVVTAGEVPAEICDDETRVIDAHGKTVVPGLIDPHTHLIHGGSRENELAMKLNGASYLDILKKGGGILSTVKATRKASVEELKAKAWNSLDQMLLHGTTTVEAKSGYGLDLDNEIKCLQLAWSLNLEHPVDIVRTYMGAHAIPPEYKHNPAKYIDFMLYDVMPNISENGHAEFMDVFCEEGVFSPEQARILMKAGKQMRFKLKIHADEIVPLQGAELAAEMQAVSADHLLAASDEGLLGMRDAGVTAVLLPGTSYYLMLNKYAQARKMIDMGIRVALASDYNPGTCPCENLQTIMTFACFGMHMTPAEILPAMTINAAHAIDRSELIGSLEEGKQADIIILNAPNWEYVIYHYGINHVDKVIKNGRVVVNNTQLVYQGGDV